MERRLGLIGAGNMSSAILGGILRGGVLSPEKIFLSNPHPEKLAPFAEQGVNTSLENAPVIRNGEILILGIKPQMFPNVLPELSGAVRGKCVVSISPGYSLRYLQETLPGAYVVRAMPNTPLLMGKGCTALARGLDVPEKLFRDVKAIFSAAGEVFVVEEQQLDAVMAVAGSSPAYFFRMAEAMAQAVSSYGLDEAEAVQMAALTMEGAAKMLLESGKPAGELRRQVCSPGGTTLAALSAFDDYQFETLISQAVERCIRRSEELGK